MKSRIKQRIIFRLMTPVVAVALSACSDKAAGNDDRLQANECQVTMKLTSLGAATRAGGEATRAGGAEPDAAIHAVDLLVFDGNGKSRADAQFKYSRTAWETTSGSGTYQAVLEQADSLDVYFAVNAHSLIAGVTEGMTWKEAKEKLILSNLPKTLADNLTTTGLPMWGECLDLCIKKGSSYQTLTPSIRLVRAVASTDVDIQATNFTLSAGWMVYGTSSGYLPYTDNLNSSGTSYVFDTPDVVRPVVYANDWSVLPSAVNKITDRLYMYENDTQADNTKLILAGKWSGSTKTTDTYYPLAFIDPNVPTQARAVTRNTKFLFIITNVNGDGYDNIEDAKKGEPVNMAYDVVEWNRQTDGDIMVDGSKYLIIDKRWSDAHVGPSVGSYLSLALTTNFDLAHIMLKPKGDAGTGSNTSAETARFRLELVKNTGTAALKLSALEAYDAAATDLVQQFTVTCGGKLTFDLRVTQDPTDPNDWDSGYSQTVDQQD
jgi:hypothetical protein